MALGKEERAHHYPRYSVNCAPMTTGHLPPLFLFHVEPGHNPVSSVFFLR